MILLFRILYFVLPTCLLMALNMGFNRLASFISNPTLKLISIVALGFVTAGILYLLIRFLARRARMSPPPAGPWKSLVPGILMGLLLSIIAGFLFSQTHGLPIDSQQFTEHLYPHVFKQIPHAVTEEVDFRLGIVGGANALGGEIIAGLAGSIPFGVLHAVDIFFGVPVTFEQVIGVSLAGLLLTILYLRIGLGAAIGLHYAWNWLVPAWVFALHLPIESGGNQLEGAWTTSVAIVVFLVFTVWWKRKRA